MPCSSSPPIAKARAAGLLYIAIILAGTFAYAVVPSILLAPADPAATARNVAQAEWLYRSGFVAGLVMAICNVPLAVLFYEMFSPSHRTAAALAVSFLMLGTAVEASMFINQLAPLRLRADLYAESLSVAGAEALSYLHLRLQGDGFDIATSFFAFYDVAIGYVIIRSGLLPRVIGALMVGAGLSYLVNSFTSFLAPAVAGQLYPFVLIPSFLGEASLSLWLAVFGINATRWRAVGLVPSRAD